jgi:hypothetical protein
VHDLTYSRELLVSNKSNGYRDIIGKIDLSTYRRIPWEDNVPFFLVYFQDQESDELLPVDPRSILEKFANKARDMGWECMSGAEFEYFQYAETPQSLEQKRFVGLSPLTPGAHGYSLLRTTMNKDYFYDLYNVSTEMDVEIEGHRGCELGNALIARYRDGPRCVRDGPGVHRHPPHGGQRRALQAYRQEHWNEAQHHADVHGQAVGERVGMLGPHPCLAPQQGGQERVRGHRG